MQELVNLTPHTIQVMLPDNKVLALVPSGVIARCEQKIVPAYAIGAVPVYLSSYGAVSGLPIQKEGTYYIVSSIVAQAMLGKRTDLLVPCLYERDASGKILGCRGLAKLDNL